MTSKSVQSQRHRATHWFLLSLPQRHELIMYDGMVHHCRERRGDAVIPRHLRRAVQKAYILRSERRCTNGTLVSTLATMREEWRWPARVTTGRPIQRAWQLTV